MAEERVRTNALDDGPYVLKKPMVVVDTFRAERRKTRADKGSGS